MGVCGCIYLVWILINDLQNAAIPKQSFSHVLPHRSNSLQLLWDMTIKEIDDKTRGNIYEADNKWTSRG